MRLELHRPHVLTGQDPPLGILLLLHRIAEEAHTARHSRGRFAATGEDVQHNREGGVQIRVQEVRQFVLHRGSSR